jgi:hypothetical protein
MPKIVVNVIKKQPDARDLVKECLKNQVIVRGEPENIRKVLRFKKSKIASAPAVPVPVPGPVPSSSSSLTVIARIFIKYFLWRCGGCELRDRCINDSDFYTSMDIGKIPHVFLFCTGSQFQVYGFDIRSLVYYRTQGLNFRNPYTDQPFAEADIKRLDRKLKWLTRFGFPTEHRQPSVKETRWTPENIRQYTINIFSLISEHQYVDPDWFIGLSFYGLQRLYGELFDIWSFRLGMDEAHKQRITKGQLFSNNEQIQQYQYSMSDKLRVELLKNMERLVGDGVDEDHRKTGCYIFMLGLVLVSEDAATSHPTMYQAAYYES